MINNHKLNFFNKLAFLNDLASKGVSTLPNEISLFLMRELEIKSVVLLSELNENNFSVIGRTASAERVFDLGELFKIKNYSTISQEKKFNDTFVTNCEIDFTSLDNNLQAIAFGYKNNSTGIILLSHKILPVEEDQKKYFSIAEIISQLLTNWKNSGGIVKSSSNLQFTDLVFKSSKGFRKISANINGFISNLKKEKISDNALKYLDNINENNQFLFNSFGDMIDLTKFEQENFILNSSKSNIEKLINRVIDNYKKNDCTEINFNVDNQITKYIEIDENIFTSILQSLITTTCIVSENKQITISSKLSSSNKVYFSISTIAPQICLSNTQNLKEPFVLTDLLDKAFPQISGLSLTLVKKYIELINGSFKITTESQDIFKFLISFKTNSKPKDKVNIDSSTNLLAPKNKILIIESDQASSILLQKHLSKWNYKTEFVNSGTKALSLLNKEKYIAIILDIDHENENSLKLLQKIKNTNSTRNIPVIVFSIEPEKEQIFLMGSVDYMVKPINYNNLVEILTSYKLRRDSNVLCVDDDKPTLKLVEQAIKTAGFNVTAESQPELVIDIIENLDLDLAIIDLDMPKLNGVELIKQIKSIQKFAKLPIIIYTGKEDYEDDLANFEGMFDELLNKKSTSFNELEKVISEMITSYEETKTLNEKSIDTNSPNILMAEDYKHSQIIVTRLLKKNGFENITVVENGKEALDICEQEKIDIILMDMQMPVMNGFEATGKIRELDGYEDTPIIALTAFAMKGDREKCLEAGATDYIAKPIDSKEFIEKVKYYAQQKVES